MRFIEFRKKYNVPEEIIKLIKNKKIRAINKAHRSGDYVYDINNEYILKISLDKDKLLREKVVNDELENKLPLSKKIKWLSNLLWGGSALLAFEHVWHGEIEPFFPFLTAAKSSAEWTAALQEMSTAGVVMAVSVTLFWTGMVAVSNVLEKRKKLTLQPVRKEQ